MENNNTTANKNETYTFTRQELLNFLSFRNLYKYDYFNSKTGFVYDDGKELLNEEELIDKYLTERHGK